MEKEIDAGQLGAFVDGTNFRLYGFSEKGLAILEPYLIHKSAQDALEAEASRLWQEALASPPLKRQEAAAQQYAVQAGKTPDLYKIIKKAVRKTARGCFVAGRSVRLSDFL